MASPPSDHICDHERFYFSDGSLYLLVERSLYCVHRSLFEIHASKFPACGHDSAGGEICFLKDVKKIDFDRLLACLYPRALFVEEAKSTEEWISILKLALKWGFESLQSRAISKIEHTLASPVDMVLFGRQYNVPDILLLGYATLCQGTTPLSSEEGRRLGVDDVVNIYRIRHELYGSVITPVPFEEALEKVRISLPNEEHGDEKDLEAEHTDPDLDDQQSSEWMDAGSVAASQQSLEEAISLTTDPHTGTDGSDGCTTGSLYADPASQTSPAERDKEIASTDNTNTSTCAERPEDQPYPVSGQEQSDTNTISLPSETPFDASPSAERSKAQEDVESEEERFDEPSLGGPPTIASSSRSGGIPTIIPNGVHVLESSGSTGQVFRLLNELTTNNFDPVTNSIIQWFKALRPMPNSQTLYQITQSIVERATAKQPGQLSILARLCQGMVTRLANVQVQDPKGQVSSGGLLFRDYLGGICHENLKALAVAAGERTAEFRRLLLIEFISKLAKPMDVKIWTLDIIDKWVAALLDGNDEEKVVILCMLMRHAGPLWDNSPKKKLRTHINRWFQEMSNVAKKTSKPRVRTLLQDVIRRRNLGWVAK